MPKRIIDRPGAPEKAERGVPVWWLVNANLSHRIGPENQGPEDQPCKVLKTNLARF
jgi:hypothetical protein